MLRNDNAFFARLAGGGASALLVIVGLGLVATSAEAQTGRGGVTIQPAGSKDSKYSPRRDGKTEDPILSKECQVGPDGSVVADSLHISETKDGRRMIICSDRPKGAARS